MERYLKHDWIERAGHWIHVVNVVLLVLSGIQIHVPSWNIFGSLNNARIVHFLDMYIFLLIGVVHVYFFFALGKYKVAMFNGADVTDVIPTIKWYLFLSDWRPDYAKYNVLQKLSYAALFVVSAVQALLGFALYRPDLFGGVVSLTGGLLPLRAYHYLISWVFISFTAVHLYLILTEDIRLLWAMIHGRYYRRAATKG
jgi:Ni/Fe-hydrogenase 1 B-type cytochrome subunit